MAENIFEQAQPASTDAPQTQTTKKSKKGLIISLIIAAVLAIAGVVTALVVHAINNTPEKIALKTIKNTLRDTAVNTSGTVALKFSDEDYSSFRTIQVELEGTSDLLPLSASAHVSLQTTDRTTYAFDLDTVIADDATFYVKLDDLSSLLEAADLSRAQLRQLSSITQMFEGKWWSLDLAELFDLYVEQSSSVTFGGEYTTVTNPIPELIKCGTKALDSYKSDPSPLLDLYATYHFISFTATDGEPTQGGKLYQVSLDQDLAQDFLAELADLDLFKSTARCIRRAGSSLELDSDTFFPAESSLSEFLDALQDQLDQTTIEVKNYHIVAYSTTAEYQGVKMKSSFSFDYPGTVTVDVPTSASSILDLAQNFIGGYSSYGSNSYDYYDYLDY